MKNLWQRRVCITIWQDKITHLQQLKICADNLEYISKKYGRIIFIFD